MSSTPSWSLQSPRVSELGGARLAAMTVEKTVEAEAFLSNCLVPLVNVIADEDRAAEETVTFFADDALEGRSGFG